MNGRLDRWIGIPFADGGRSMDGCDCWGLVRMVMLAERGVTLPDYQVSVGDVAGFETARAAAFERGQWLPVVGEPQDCDVVLMTRHARVERGGRARFITAPGHVGILLGGKLLHTEHGINSVAVDPDHYSVRNRILGVFRWAG